MEGESLSVYISKKKTSETRLTRLCLLDTATHPPDTLPRSAVETVFREGTLVISTCSSTTLGTGMSTICSAVRGWILLGNTMLGTSGTSLNTRAEATAIEVDQSSRSETDLHLREQDGLRHCRQQQAGKVR